MAVQSTMQKAWLKQFVKLQRSRRPWNQVAGPAGATVLYLKQLQWQVRSAFEWQTDLGDLVDIRQDAPSTVRKLIHGATERLIWREWAKEESSKTDSIVRDPEGYWMEEARGWTNGEKKDWTNLQSACLGSLICGSQWPQARLYEAGIVDDFLCQHACRHPAQQPTGIGTAKC